MSRWRFILASLAFASASLSSRLSSGEPEHDAARARATAEIREFLRRKVAAIQALEPAAATSREDWQERRGQLREQLFDMLGLWPLPPRGELRAEVTGQAERAGVVVERLHFQSVPGLYVTANFYRPSGANGPLPTILYLCGHGRAVVDGVSYGNKVTYQHHGCWFARHGYNCLTIDTVQLGEIEGAHHGTYRLGRWWWIARGYTPAGVEAWNAIRALDYLATRREVDIERLGVTGRSGGGAYSWWLAALDDRPACLAPVAGITDLTDHVVADCIEGHCDCMYLVNRDRWDFATLACLAAPRPLLLCNTDNDRIFPLAGVERVHDRLRRLYASCGATDKLGLFISPGPHADTQELQLGVFRWMNRHLRGDESAIADVAEKLFTPAELKVFATLPADERNTTIDESFVPAATLGPVPEGRDAWQSRSDLLLATVGKRSLGAHDGATAPLDSSVTLDDTASGIRLRAVEFTSEENLRFVVYLTSLADAASSRTAGDKQTLKLSVLDDEAWQAWQRTYAEHFPRVFGGVEHPTDDAAKFPLPRPGEIVAAIAPRGWGSNAWLADERTQTHLPRRFVLVGTTVDEGRIWDVRRAVAAIREMHGDDAPLTISGRGPAAAIALYAGLFEQRVSGFELTDLAADPHHGPVLIGIQRVLTMPEAVALAFPRDVELRGGDLAAWHWSREVARLYGEDSPLRLGVE